MWTDKCWWLINYFAFKISLKKNGTKITQFQKMIKKESKYRISITTNMNKVTIKLQYPSFHEECF